MSGANTVTIDRATWDLHQRALGLLNKMADHPDEGIAFKKMAKKIDGTLQFADLDVAERLQKPIVERQTATEARIQAMEEERAAEKLARQEQEHVRTLSSDVDAAVKRFGLTDEGREKMTTRMKEKGNLDAEAAAAWVASQAPKAKPSEGSGAFGPTALNAYGSAEIDETARALHEDPIRWQDAEIAKILAEESLVG